MLTTSVTIGLGLTSHSRNRERGVFACAEVSPMTTDERTRPRDLDDTELDHALQLLYDQHRNEPENRPEIHAAIAAVLLEQSRRRDVWLSQRAVTA